jgi:hypothetical protein
MDDRDCNRGPEHYVGHPPDCPSRSIRYRLDPPSHGHRDGAGYRDDEPGPIAGRLIAPTELEAEQRWREAGPGAAGPVTATIARVVGSQVSCEIDYAGRMVREAEIDERVFRVCYPVFVPDADPVASTLWAYDPVHASFPHPDQDDARDRFVMVEEPPLVGADDNGAPVYSVLDRRNNRKHFFSECRSAVERYVAERNKEERERLDAEAAWEMAVVEALADDPDHTTAGPGTPKGQDEPTPAEALGEPPVPPVELPPDLGDDGRRLVLAELLEHEADRLQRDGTLGPVSAWYLAHLMREAGGFARLTGAATLDQVFDRAEALTESR